MRENEENFVWNIHVIKPYARAVVGMGERRLPSDPES